MKKSEHEPVTVLVVDDDMTFRQVIAMFLEGQDDISVIACAADGHQALALCLEFAPDVVLLDMNMPGGGIDAIRSINRQLPTTKIVMLTGSDDQEDVYGALRAGASAYVLKAGFMEELGDVIRNTADGAGIFLSPSIASNVLAEFGYPATARPFKNSRP